MTAQDNSHRDDSGPGGSVAPAAGRPAEAGGAGRRLHRRTLRWRGTSRAQHTPRPLSTAVRLVRVLVGAGLTGVGVALVARAHLGLMPVDVLHAAVAHHTGWTFGGAIIAVQAVLLALWVPLGIRPGPATVAAAALPGVGCDLTLALVPQEESLVPRLVELLGGGALVVAGSALCLGARLGVGPRDGIVTRLGRRRRTAVAVHVMTDLVLLTGGWLMLGPAPAVRSGIVGVGGVLLSLIVGPFVVRHLRMAGEAARSDSL